MSAWVWVLPLTVWGAVVLCVAIALLADLVDRASARRARRIRERDNADRNCARRRRARRVWLGRNDIGGGKRV